MVAAAVLAVFALLLSLGAIGARLGGEAADSAAGNDGLATRSTDDAVAEAPVFTEPGGGAIEESVPGLPSTTGPDIAITANVAITAADDQTMASTSDAVALLASRNGARIAAQSGYTGGFPNGIVEDDATAWNLVVRLRVPPASTDALLADLAELGTVTSSDRTDEDLTAAVADTESRVQSARISLARVQALMEKATTLDEILRLEQELSIRQADLDAQLATAAALADRTTEADITLSITGAAGTGTPADEDTNPFLAGWNAGVDLLLGGLAMLATAAGFLLPLLPILLLIGAAGVLAWRRHRGAAPASAQAAAPAAATHPAETAAE